MTYHKIKAKRLVGAEGTHEGRAQRHNLARRRVVHVEVGLEMLYALLCLGLLWWMRREFEKLRIHRDGMQHVQCLLSLLSLSQSLNLSLS